MRWNSTSIYRVFLDIQYKQLVRLKITSGTRSFYCKLHWNSSGFS